MDEIDLMDLDDALAYYPEQGIFIWKISKKGAKAGDIAGCECPDGFVRIGFNRKRYLAQDLAWAVVHGSWPECVLTHKNGDRSDNRIENLTWKLPNRPLVASHSH
jgi:hypothetical protein